MGVITLGFLPREFRCICQTLLLPALDNSFDALQKRVRDFSVSFATYAYLVNFVTAILLDFAAMSNYAKDKISH